MNYYDKQNASWALCCIQADLRHRIGRKEGTTHLDSRCTAKFEQVIPCDDGGRVKIDDLIKMEVLWTHHSRKISVNGDIRGADQQRRIYNQRLQLLFNGNLLAARQLNGKVRLQFLGVRVKDPPEGPQRVGWAGLVLRAGRSCEILEKITGESLECELVLDYKASPILDGYKRYRTPAHVMTILCEMPTGPHQAEKERLLRALAAAVDYPLNDDRREHHMREAVIFMIKRTPMRLLPRNTLSFLEMHAMLVALHLVRKVQGKRTCRSGCTRGGSKPQHEQAMEAAAAAVPAEDDDQLEETMTVAEPEGEVGEQQPSDGEPDPDEEMVDISEPVEGAADESLEDRRPIIVPGRTDYINPDLQIAQAAMQPLYFYDRERGRCIDSSKNAFACMAYFICRTIYKTWPTTTSWMSMPYELMQERFRAGARYDVLGSWPLEVCAVDQETHTIKEVADEELRTCVLAEDKEDPQDPERIYVIKRFRTAQTLSMIARGSIINGYNRATFNPATYLNRGQDEKQMHYRQDEKQMHYSCLGVLSDLIPRITGYVQFSLIRPAPAGKVEFLYIDPVGVLLMQSMKDNTAVTTALLIDHNIQVPARFIDRLNKRKIDAEQNPQHRKHRALHHLDARDYLSAGQTSIMYTEVTQEERERVSRPSHPKAPPSHREGQRRIPRNANASSDKGTKGKGKSKTLADREAEASAQCGTAAGSHVDFSTNDMRGKLPSLTEEEEAGPDGFKYLLSMKLWSLTENKVEELQRLHGQKDAALHELRGTSIEALWEADLQRLEHALDECDEKDRKEAEAAERLAAKNMSDESFLVNKQCVLVLGRNFTAKRVRTSEWKARRRGGGFSAKRLVSKAKKGKDDDADAEEDADDAEEPTEGALSAVFCCHDFDALLVFSEHGYVYMLQALDVPLVKKCSMQGAELKDLPAELGVRRALTTDFLPELQDHRITALVTVAHRCLRDQTDEFVVLVSKKGFAKKVSIDRFRGLRPGKGLPCMKLAADDELQWAHKATANSALVVATAEGGVLRVSLGQDWSLNTAKGREA
eukprot:s2620_g18.t2